MYNIVWELQFADTLSGRCHPSGVGLEFQFKQDVPRLRTYKESAKELFDKLMHHCEPYIMKARLFTEIEYEQHRGHDVIKKTSTYSSFRGVRYLCTENADQFYNHHMNMMLCRLKHHFIKSDIKVIR